MAIIKKNLGVVETSISAVKSIESTHNKVVEFYDPGGADVTLPVGTPVAFNGATWEPATAADPSGTPLKCIVRGFVYPDPILLDKDGTNLGVIMFSGRIGYADIDWTYVVGSATDGTVSANDKKLFLTDPQTFHANVKAVNPPTLRELGIIVEDYDLVQ